MCFPHFPICQVETRLKDREYPALNYIYMFPKTVSHSTGIEFKKENGVGYYINFTFLIDRGWLGMLQLSLVGVFGTPHTVKVQHCCKPMLLWNISQIHTAQWHILISIDRPLRSRVNKFPQVNSSTYLGK